MCPIGITERGDASQDFGWKPWVKADKPAILITKSPLTLRHFLTGKENIIVHCTITGMGQTKYETGTLSWAKEIEGYKALVELFGVDRTVLRVDPIIPTQEGLDKALQVIRERHPNGRLRISFMDMYPHVQKRFLAAGIPIPYTTTHAPLQQRQSALRLISEEAGIVPEVCGEPGINCTGCVSLLDCAILGVTPKSGGKGQRAACPCLMEKTELLTRRGQCSFACTYCYWHS